ncbi:MAG: hypothetical protein U1A78_40180 [Polyangia bacterium]
MEPPALSALPSAAARSGAAAGAVAAPSLGGSLYGFLFDSLTAAPPYGGPAILDAAQCHLSLLLPGTPLSGADYANPWSPTNPEGDLLAAENLARLTDVVPALSPVYEETGQSLDQLFGQLVCADVFSDPSVSTPLRRNSSFAAKMRFFPSRRPVDQVGVRTAIPVRALLDHAVRIQRADLSRLQMLSPAQILQQGMTALPTGARDALKLLVHEAVDYDGAGARIKVLEDSPRYQEYLVHRLQYESAALRFMAGYLSQSARQAPARKAWSTQGRGQERELGKLRQMLTTAEALKIEAALGARDFSAVRGGPVGVLFDAARLRYELTKRRSVHNPYVFWHASQAAPSDWHDPRAEYAEAQIRLSRSPDRPSPADTPGAALHQDLWRVGSVRQSAWTERALSLRTKNLGVSFGFQRVQISRPWLQSMLLGLGSWSQPGQKRNTYSTGSADENPGSFPLLPVAMIVARDITITADWDPEDRELLAACIADGRRLSLGPFVISGSYGASSRENRLGARLEDQTVRIPGLQLVGWISERVPACPPLDG